MKELVQRLAALEESAPSGIEKDLRVIDMQIARAEDKILRLGQSSSWTRPSLLLRPSET